MCSSSFHPFLIRYVFFYLSPFNYFLPFLIRYDFFSFLTNLCCFSLPFYCIKIMRDMIFLDSKSSLCKEVDKMLVELDCILDEDEE